MLRPPSSSRSVATITDPAFLDSDSDNEGEKVDGNDNQVLRTRFRLRLYASNLPKRGGLRSRLPDSFAIVKASEGSQSLMKEGIPLGATEIAESSRHPQWAQTFILDYTHGEQLYFNVLIMDASSTNGQREVSTNHGYGTAVFEVADILGTKHRTRARRLRRGGVVFCRLDPIQERHTQQFAVFRLAARNLVVPTRTFGVFSSTSAPNTIIKISKQDDTTRIWQTVYRSQPVYDSVNPAWDRIEVDLSSLCEGNLQKPLRFSVLMVREKKRAVILGMIETTLEHVLNFAVPTTKPISRIETGDVPDPGDPYLQTFCLYEDPEDHDKHTGFLVVRRVYTYEVAPDGTRRPVDGTDEGDRDSPRLRHRVAESITEAHVDPEAFNLDSSMRVIDQSVGANLLQLVDQGCDLQVSVAIDFTSSNGDTSCESSLHFQSTSLNVYEETIATVVGAIQDEVQPRLGYKVWGFGAKFSHDGEVQHIFRCGEKEMCRDVPEILEAYKSVFTTGFYMSGPTVCEKVLQAAAMDAKRSQDQPQLGILRYHVLLIITDGNMSNMGEMRRKMSVYRALPLSVIFVGVGRTDFVSLRELCHEFRDEATFVDFRQVQSNPMDLANAALRNLPRQIDKYIQRSASNLTLSGLRE